jgi:glycosyltransferase involved in cell wall biosynthesis
MRAGSDEFRIWVVNHHADPPEGMATRTFDIARRWVEVGNEVTIFVSNLNHYDFRRMRKLGWRLWWEEEMDGVRLVWIQTSPYSSNDWRRVLNMLSFAILSVLAGAFRRPAPDIVIGVSVHPFAAFAGWLLARLRRARFFFEVTDLWPQTLIEFGLLDPKSASAWLMRFLEAFLYRRAERIIMLWRHTHDYVESLGISGDKVLWIPHGVELDRYRGLVAYDGAPTRPFRFVYLGGFVESMALDVLLDAAELMQRRGRTDVKFLLFGSGTHKKSLVDSAVSKSLENLKFLDPVPKRDIAHAMNQADAFVWGVRDLQIYRFGMSLNKLGDYLAGGRPIVYYGRSSYDPVSEVGLGFTVPPGDPEALADAFEKLADLSPKERQDMGARAREYLLEHHDIPRLATRLLEAFRGPVEAGEVAKNGFSH